MKKCPECRRDYYDDSLLYCLDDGTVLLEGPSSRSEPATAVLSDSATRVYGGTTSEVGTSSDPGVGERPETFSAEAYPQNTGGQKFRWPAAAGLVVLISLAGFFGYRYIASAGSSGIRSIAVLPFENRSTDSDTEYLSDGLAESLIYRLSQIPELKVSPRSSVFRYKGQNADAEKVGGELGVDAVMSGRLVQRGDNLTISVDLVDVRNKRTLWGEQFERKMSDLLATQREIASAITEKLQLKLAGGDNRGITKQYTTSNEAYQLYLKGRFYWSKRTADNINKAIEVLNQATQKDPNFALAYSALADCYVVMSTYSGARAATTMPQARDYARRSIELDPTLAEPHAALGLINWALDWDKESAEREFKTSIELNAGYGTAHHWYSRFLRSTGRTEEGLREIKLAEELDPLSLIFINNVAEAQLQAGDVDGAAATCQRMLELDPSFWAAYQTLFWIRVKQGRFEDGLTAAQKSVELSGRSNASLAQLGHAYGRVGRAADARTQIAELEKKFENNTADVINVAEVYVGLGDADKAFEWLEKGFTYRSFQLTTIIMDPLLDPLHDDPRWGSLKRRVGIPE